MILAIPRGPIVWESGEALRGRIERSVRVTGGIIVCPWVHSAVEEPFPGGMSCYGGIASQLLIHGPSPGRMPLAALLLV
jgi:hypothetical protein